MRVWAAVSDTWGAEALFTKKELALSWVRAWHRSHWAENVRRIAVEEVLTVDAEGCLRLGSFRVRSVVLDPPEPAPWEAPVEHILGEN